MKTIYHPGIHHLYECIESRLLDPSHPLPPPDPRLVLQLEPFVCPKSTLLLSGLIQGHFNLQPSDSGAGQPQQDSSVLNLFSKD